MFANPEMLEICCSVAAGQLAFTEVDDFFPDFL
jgi:hypothetical protein